MRHISGVPRPEEASPASRAQAHAARERRLWPRVPRVEPLRFRRIPLLAAALCFALGEAISRIPNRPPAPSLLFAVALAALVGLVLLALRFTLRLALLPLAALWIAAGLWAAQIEPAPDPQTALLPYADGLSRTVRGRITRIRELPARPPNTEASLQPDRDFDQWDQPGTPTLSFDLAVTAIEDLSPDTSRIVPITAGVRATVYTDQSANPGANSSAALTAAPSAPALLPLHCGDLIEAPLRLRLPERYRDPGAWQYADYLLSQGIAATASLSAAHLQPQLHAVTDFDAPRPPLAATLHCGLFAAQTWAAARLLAFTRSPANRSLPPFLRLTPDDAGMLNAMLFGDRSRLTHQLRLGFEQTGSFHLFVVSGLHVALLAGGLLWLCRRLRLRAWLSTPLILAVTAAYAALTGFGVPVQRALLMTAVFLTARLLFRDRSPLNALGAAALAVLVWSPRALFEASFQMTFLALLAIAGVAAPLAERTFLPCARAARSLHYRWRDNTLPPRLAQLRVMLRLWGEAVADLALSAGLTRPRPQRYTRNLPAVLFRATLWATELALIGLVAEAVMTLPMALYFHRATVFALPANMVSIPLVALLAPLALVTWLASLLSSSLSASLTFLFGPHISPHTSSLLASWPAALPGAATALLLHTITAAIARVGHLQLAGLRVAGPSVTHALAAVACVALSVWMVRSRSRVHAASAPAFLLLAIAFALWPEPPLLHPDQLEVTALDVGQGDSLLVVGPTGRTLLVDAGGPTGAAANAENAAANATPFDAGEEVVSPYLWSRHFSRLDVVALTHAHSDHMGGLPAVLRNLRPRELWVSVDPDSPAYRDLLAEARTLGTTVRHLRAGDTLPWDSVTIAVLAPAAAYVNPGPPTNNDSLVLHLQFGQASVLLEGDAEAPSEQTMIAQTMLAEGAPALASAPYPREPLIKSTSMISCCRHSGRIARNLSICSSCPVPVSATLEPDQTFPGSPELLGPIGPNPTALGPVTLLKVAHHGSRTSTTPGFLALVQPRDAILSVGRQNTFGHPRPEIIARLAAAHTRLYRTDLFGLTTFLLQRDGHITAQTAPYP